MLACRQKNVSMEQNREFRNGPANIWSFYFPYTVGCVIPIFKKNKVKVAKAIASLAEWKGPRFGDGQSHSLSCVQAPTLTLVGTPLSVSLHLFPVLSKSEGSPGPLHSVDRALAWVPKGPRFISCQGHMPGSWTWSPVWGPREAANQ